MNSNTDKKTSWNSVARWYDEYLETSEDSYQKHVILPNMLRLLDIKKGDRVLDIACGQGFFSRAFFEAGAEVTGVDISSQLIAYAKKRSQKIRYHVVSADALGVFAAHSFNSIVIILAIQNIKNISGVFSECYRLLADKGKFFIVMNHPSFRVPKHSQWGWDAKQYVQYRRVDRYLTESRELINMHPGQKYKQTTISFHRPLQTYVNMLVKHDLGIIRAEEWISHKKSMKGPRKAAEDNARKEIPLFLMLATKKLYA